MEFGGEAFGREVRLDEVGEVGPMRMELVPLQEETEGPLSPPCEDTEKSRQSASREEGPL